MVIDNTYNYNFYQNYDLQLPKSTYVKKGLTGLVNTGNKCFLISILQCLSNTLTLTDYFLSRKYMDEDTDNSLKTKKEHIILISYVKLLSNIWEKNQLLKPKSFTEHLSKFIKKYYTFDQQDSHECLLYILDHLHKALSYEIEVDINGVVKTRTDELMKKSLESWKLFYEKGYSFIIQTFNGLNINEVKCNNCDYKDEIFEPYNCLSVNIPNSTSSLQDCLSDYFHENENVNNWTCEKCNNTGCVKRCKAWSLPNYIIINLKRFTSNGQKKIHTIDFPHDDLDMTPYVSKERNDPNNYIYTLYAINHHSGSVSSGHYWSSCKNLNDNWYRFDDGNVSKIENITEITKDAYILMYHRKFIK